MHFALSDRRFKKKEILLRNALRAFQQALGALAFALVLRSMRNFYFEKLKVNGSILALPRA
jgi:hypothetical protein